MLGVLKINTDPVEHLRDCCYQGLHTVYKYIRQKQTYTHLKHKHTHTHAQDQCGNIYDLPAFLLTTLLTIIKFKI